RRPPSYMRGKMLRAREQAAAAPPSHPAQAGHRFGLRPLRSGLTRSAPRRCPVARAGGLFVFVSVEGCPGDHSSPAARTPGATASLPARGAAAMPHTPSTRGLLRVAVYEPAQG